LLLLVGVVVGLADSPGLGAESIALPADFDPVRNSGDGATGTAAVTVWGRAYV
jgi:hypothetical protein